MTSDYKHCQLLLHARASLLIVHKLILLHEIFFTERSVELKATFWNVSDRSAYSVLSAPNSVNISVSILLSILRRVTYA